MVHSIWPHGVSKADTKLVECRNPGTSERRKWFDHDPECWNEFHKRYRKELDASDEARQALADLRKHARKRRVALVFVHRDEEHNNAVVLQALPLDSRQPEC